MSPDVRTLSIAVCTRDRPEDLRRCLRSLVHGMRPRELEAVEVLIIDDGENPAQLTTDSISQLSNAGLQVRSLRTGERRGLVEARVLAHAAASGDILLFLDDDVEIAADYMSALVSAYRRNPDAVGIGGIDELMRFDAWWKRALGRLFLYDSGAAGELSASGFTGSMWRWRRARVPFRTAFLSGCNMSFRRWALEDVQLVPWLRGYSLGEDVYLSHLAGLHGPLWIDPALRVRHYGSLVAREPVESTARATILNPYHLLRLRRAGWWQYVALHWTAFGFLVKELVRPKRWHLLGAYWAGLREVERLLARDHGSRQL